jgi:hypothetical protein
MPPAVTILGFTGGELAAGVAIFVVTLLSSLAICVLVIARLPADYFVGAEPPPPPPGPPWKRIGRVAGKNLLGAVLVLLGAAMSVPGVPGQGVLTMLCGLMLLDIPGKRRLEQRVVRSPRVLRTLNRVRARFQRDPLLPPSGAIGGASLRA